MSSALWKQLNWRIEQRQEKSYLKCSNEIKIKNKAQQLHRRQQQQQWHTNGLNLWIKCDTNINTQTHARIDESMDRMQKTNKVAICTMNQKITFSINGKVTTTHIVPIK